MQVQTRNGIVVDSAGREVAVGSPAQLWDRLQLLAKAKQAEEAKTESAGLSRTPGRMVCNLFYTVLI